MTICISVQEKPAKNFLCGVILMALSSEREQELWRLCSEGDIDAREELIIAYRPLVFWIAGKIYINDSELKQDMIQEGMLALINAVDKFQPEREYKFSTYAYYKIHGQMINLLERSEKRAPVPVPDEWLQVSEDDSEQADDDWLDAQEVTPSSYGVKNAAVAIDLILKLVERNLTQLQEGYAKLEDDRRYVPLSTVIGRRKIPASAAKTISRALAKLQGAGDIKEVELWRGLEILAEKYLGD